MNKFSEYNLLDSKLTYLLAEKILPIAKELRDGGIIGGISLSVQSLDPTTLKNIKRANIKFEKKEKLKKYGIIVGGIIGVGIGAIVIYQFVANL